MFDRFNEICNNKNIFLTINKFKKCNEFKLGILQLAVNKQIMIINN